MNHEEKLSNCLMIILELYLKVNTNQNMEKFSKYYLLNKCFKDYQYLAQVKVGNTSENLLNEIRQVIYSLYREKELTKNVYNNIMDSIKL